MKKRWLVFWEVTIYLWLCSWAYAWNDIGHEVVARIAWDHLTPKARQNVIALLQMAPEDADLSSLFSADSRPLWRREREFFLKASTWPDIVRSDQFPARKQKYHRADWHFINYFWEQPDPQKPPRDRKDIKPKKVNVVERLHHLARSVVDLGEPESMRAVDLAWILHLTGDIHQPLHCSARVMPTEPEGDRGGNDFLIGGSRTLHSFWDGIIQKSYRKKAGESEDAYINRIAAVIIQHYPWAAMVARLKPGRYTAWAREGHATAKRVVYPPSLKRHQEPSAEYRQMAHSTAEPAVALAGYRLAALLNRLFGG